MYASVHRKLHVKSIARCLAILREERKVFAMSHNNGLTNGDRRQATRYQIAWVVEMDTGTGRTRNISSSGLLFAMDRPIIVGSVIRCSLLLDGLENTAQRLHCEGEVVRLSQHETHWEIAIVFTHYRFGSGHQLVSV